MTMVSIRDVEYGGLKLRAEPADNKMFYLTGDETIFRLVVINTEDRERNGKLAITWFYGTSFTGAHDHAVISISLGSRETKEYMLEKQWHFVEGVTICCLLHVGPPEDYEKLSEEAVRKNIEGRLPDLRFDVLCTYKVLDRAVYEDERRRHEEILKEQKATRETVEKLRQDVIEVARKEARDEVLKKLALGLKMAFSQEKQPEGKEEKQEPQPYR